MMRFFLVFLLVVFATGAVAQGGAPRPLPKSLEPQPPPQPSNWGFTLTPEQVDAIVRFQTLDYLRYVLIQKCGTACIPILPPPPPPVPPPPIPPSAFNVGVVAGVSLTGVVSGNVKPGATAVEIDFDGSVVTGVFKAVPAADGSFSGQIAARFHDGLTHGGVAWAFGADGVRRRFDRVDGNGNTFTFMWKL